MKKLLLSFLLITGATQLWGAEIAKPATALDQDAITKKVNDIIAQSPITAELRKQGIIVKSFIFQNSAMNYNNISLLLYPARNITTRELVTLYQDKTFTDADLIESKEIGFLGITLHLIEKQGNYNILEIYPQYRGKNYAKSLIGLGITLMNAFNIEHRSWTASPQDETTKRDELEKLYGSYGGNIISRNERNTSMEWHSPSSIRAKL